MLEQPALAVVAAQSITRSIWLEAGNHLRPFWIQWSVIIHWRIAGKPVRVWYQCGLNQAFRCSTTRSMCVAVRPCSTITTTQSSPMTLSCDNGLLSLSCPLAAAGCLAQLWGSRIRSLMIRKRRLASNLFPRSSTLKRLRMTRCSDSLFPCPLMYRV